MNYKLSPSDLTYLYDGCKFCFWLKIKYGISQPSMPMPGIFSAIAGKQKGFYANRRTEEFCKDLPPGAVQFGEKWVQSKVIAPPGVKDGCYIKGRFDAVVKFDNESYGVIDFKTASPSDEKAEMYGKQLQAYAYALENPEGNNLKLAPVSKLGLLFFEPHDFVQMDLSTQAFKGKSIWIEVKRDDKKFFNFLHEVMKILAEETPPQPTNDCDWCNYRNKTKNIKLAEGGQNISQVTGIILCPKCNGPMTLKNGKYGEFWSCLRYPECKGTRKT